MTTMVARHRRADRISELSDELYQHVGAVKLAISLLGRPDDAVTKVAMARLEAIGQTALAVYRLALDEVER